RQSPAWLASLHGRIRHHQQPPGASGAPSAGWVFQRSTPSRSQTQTRDLPSSGRPVTLVRVKRVWRCPHALCPKSTWTETSEVIAPRACLTQRARAEICRRVGEDGASVAATARDFGVGWATAMAGVRQHGAPRVDDPARLEGVDAVGLDETAFQAASATRSTSFVTGIVDLTRHRVGPARLLDVIDDRSASALVSWVDQRDPAWRAAITTAALDPYRGYASALRAALPHAVRVLDAFHVTRLGFAAVDDVRRRIQREQTGHRGRRDDPLYRIRRLLRRAHTHHSQRSWQRLLAGLDAGDTTDEQLAHTWIAAQDLRLIFSCPDRARAAQALYRWLAYCADADIPELTRLARTLDSGRAELLAYFDTGGISNGPTEAVNLLIKKIKRVRHGFRNFDNYRLRLLLYCGVDWNTVRATPIRGRLPRLAA
ncbi:MAG: ISL3 family transposase, partial [Actinobacteria bacterium]|nr:ISL3 family transposase [Actinomycetota bacterium]